METIYLCIIIFLFILAVFDLWVGVSNDAVNFLNSSIGAKAAPFKMIIAIAALGVFCGAIMSNGMMEIARHGIFHPQYFYFTELICIMLAVMVTDVVLLDVFNSLGMPTSTTVSLVFELLGGTVALALVKSLSGDAAIPFAEMLNTDKAFSVILGIFVSVAIAFFFGALVQWITRLIFTFNYKHNLSWTIGIFGGIAATAIVYFMIIKGVKDLSFMTPENKLWTKEHTKDIILLCLLGFTALMQILHFLKVNVLKIIVLMGTFALAMAFASNDLVNFVGVPLAGYSSFMDYIANGQAIGMDQYLMGALNEPAKTPPIFLLMAGLIMVFSLIKSKKAQNVVKTSLNLSRQEEGEEMFGSSPLARKIVQWSMSVSNFAVRTTPAPIKNWIGSRFNKEELIMEEGASFDLVRASINLVLAGLLVALGTSLKLPLSTTYVTFMVAMGTSLSDNAWGRESAVFRITGVISVIGGWFITAGVAFAVCFITALIMHFGGIVAMVLLVGLSIFLLLRNNLNYGKKKQNEKDDLLFSKIMATKDNEEAWTLLKKHVRNTVSSEVEFTSSCFMQMTQAFISEDHKSIRKAGIALENERNKFKKIKRRELLGLHKIDPSIAITHNTWFHLLSNNTNQLMYCLKRMYEPCREHLDNKFNPLPQECIDEFTPLRSRLIELMNDTQVIISANNLDAIGNLVSQINKLRLGFSQALESHAIRIQESKSRSYLNIYIVYMNMLQESQQLAFTLKQLIKAVYKFEK